MTSIRHLALLSLIVPFSIARADDAQTPPAQTAPPAASAPSAEAQAKAKAHMDAGTRYYNIQQYAQAAEEYQQAYLLDPQPVYLWAVAQAHRLGGDCVKALQAYRAFLRTKPPDEAKVHANIERCEQYLRDHPPSSEPTGVAAPVAAVPSPASFDAKPVTIIKTQPTISRPWTDDWIGHGLVIAGVVGAAAGTFVLLDGRATIRDNNTAASYDEFVDGRAGVDSAHTKQVVGVSAMAVGGSLVLGGIIHYLVYTRPITDRSLSASVSAGQAAVTFTRTF